ncbi:MAG: hypothetical protein HY897_15370 [Deltaproteobacteria bacterium]|nr:hypothetical protein [Deltaproteobacteria bacterium]
MFKPSHLTILAFLLQACVETREVALPDVTNSDASGAVKGDSGHTRCWDGGFESLRRLEMGSGGVAERGGEYLSAAGLLNGFPGTTDRDVAVFPTAEEYSLHCAGEPNLSDRNGVLTVGFLNNTTDELCDALISQNEKLAWGAPGDGHRFVACEYSCANELFGEVTGTCQQDIPVSSGSYQLAFCAADRAIPFEQKLVYPNTTAAALVCPEGYTKVLKTILVGKEDSLVVVPIEAADLSSR